MSKSKKQPAEGPRVEREPGVEVDEAQLEQRRRATEELMNSPAMQAEMEACRRAFEAQQVAQETAQEAQSARCAEEDQQDQETDLGTWADSIIASRRQGPARRREQAGEDEDEVVIYTRAAPVAVEETASRETATEAPAKEPEVTYTPPPPEPVWTVKAQRAHPPEDPDDPFDLGRVANVEVRLYSGRTKYRLTLVEQGAEDRVWEGPERDGWGAALAMKKVRIGPTKSDADPEGADYGPFHALPRVHPGEVERRERASRIFQEQMGNFGTGGGRGREVWQDRCIVTGEGLGMTDGRSRW